MIRRLFAAAALVFSLVACSGTPEPLVVTEVEIEHCKVDPGLFQTETPVEYPTLPPGRERNTDVELFLTCEARAGQIEILNTRLLEVQKVVEPPPPCEDGDGGGC